MKLRIPDDQLARVHDALAKAGTREIGGQILGQQLSPSDFRATELTVQKKRGSFIQFFVDLIQSRQDSTNFFIKTRRRYTEFNYIGEWHSHPSFAIQPSSVDLDTMTSLVNDKSFAGTFAVLMIARLDGDLVSKKAWLFAPGGQQIDVELEDEE